MSALYNRSVWWFYQEVRLSGYVGQQLRQAACKVRRQVGIPLAAEAGPAELREERYIDDVSLYGRVHEQLRALQLRKEQRLQRVLCNNTPMSTHNLLFSPEPQSTPDSSTRNYQVFMLWT